MESKAGLLFPFLSKGCEDAGVLRASELVDAMS